MNDHYSWQQSCWREPQVQYIQTAALPDQEYMPRHIPNRRKESWQLQITINTNSALNTKNNDRRVEKAALYA